MTTRHRSHTTAQLYIYAMDLLGRLGTPHYTKAAAAFYTVLLCVVPTGAPQGRYNAYGTTRRTRISISSDEISWARLCRPDQPQRKRYSLRVRRFLHLWQDKVIPNGDKTPRRGVRGGHPTCGARRWRVGRAREMDHDWSFHLWSGQSARL